jgi:hypothetical protein
VNPVSPAGMETPHSEAAFGGATTAIDAVSMYQKRRFVIQNAAGAMAARPDGLTDLAPREPGAWPPLHSTLTKSRWQVVAYIQCQRQCRARAASASKPSATAIAAVLNERRIRTARGGAWHDSTVRNLLARQQAA